MRSWVLSAVGVVAAGALGATLALTGVISRPTVDAPLTTAVIDARTVNAHECVGGPVVSTLYAGQRVFVVATSADGDWVGVRATGAVSTAGGTGEVVWMPQPDVTLDESDSLADAVPTGGVCPTVTTEVGFADPKPDTTPADPADPADPASPTPNQPPAGDTSKPKLSAPSVQPAVIACADGYGYPTTALITVTASDNVAVTSVSIAWTGSYTGSGSMTRSGSTWKYTFDATGPGDRGDVNFRMVAKDAAGNSSAASTTSVFVDCLI